MSHLRPIIQRVRRGRQRNARSAVGALHLTTGLALAALLMLLPTPAGAARVVVTNGPYTPIRLGPSRAHARLTELQAGIPLWAEDKTGGWFRLRLTDDLQAWVHEVSVAPLPRGGPPPPGLLRGASIGPSDKGVRIALRVGRRVAYRVRQSVHGQRLALDLFGVRLSHCRWACLMVEPFIASVRLRQAGRERVELSVTLSECQQRGYQVGFVNDRDIVLEVRRPYRPGGVRGRLVVIDPGHGGSDDGAHGPTGLKEKDANLAIALDLAALLQAEGCRVALTRQTDTSIAGPKATKRTELCTRVATSRNLWPDIFVSIHCNHSGTFRRPDVAGTESYFWSPMSARPAALIQRALSARLGTQSRLVAPRPFRVLRETDCPRVLVECCYLSCPWEEAMMRDPRSIRLAAQGISEGLNDYFRTAAPRR